jgi:hypothetical protein
LNPLPPLTPESKGIAPGAIKGPKAAPLDPQEEIAARINKDAERAEALKDAFRKRDPDLFLAARPARRPRIVETAAERLVVQLRATYCEEANGDVKAWAAGHVATYSKTYFPSSPVKAAETVAGGVSAADADPSAADTEKHRYLWSNPLTRRIIQHACTDFRRKART